MQLKITNPKVIFDLQLNRRVTVIRGESASGKTWMHEIVRTLDTVSFVDCERKVMVAPQVADGKEKETLSLYAGYLFLIDEDTRYALDKRYADAVMENDIWVVITAREVINYPYSADEVYVLKTSGKIKRLSKYYTEPVNKNRYRNKILTEDSGGGKTFFTRLGYETKSAGGKDNIRNHLEDGMLVVFDKAAIGYVYDRLYTGAAVLGTLDLVEPESFEWVLLHSEIFSKLPVVGSILQSPEEHGANNYKTWENFFTQSLCDLLSKYQGVNYSKGTLSRCFTDDCCVKQKPCALNKTGKGKLQKLAEVMGVSYLLKNIDALRIRELLPESVADAYSDTELIEKFSHLL